MKVLVTGGAGYVGSHACKALAVAGHHPIVYDDLSRGHRSSARWGTFEFGNIADATRLAEVLERHRADGVMHFAGLTSVGESVESPASYYRNNVLGSWSLLEAMRQHGPRLLVFSSSCATYGPPVASPMSEDHPQAPLSPYGASKLMVERMLQDYGTAYGLRWMSLRYFNAAGADAEGDIGEMHEPETHAIPLAISAALGRAPSFEIYGTDYPTHDGSAVRDYVHVADLASAHVAALRHLLRDGKSMALNLGTGVGTSVFEMIEAVARVGGRPVPIKRCARRPGDPPVLVADTRRTSSVLDWQLQYRSINDIVATAWAWHSAREPIALARASNRR